MQLRQAAVKVVTRAREHLDLRLRVQALCPRQHPLRGDDIVGLIDFDHARPAPPLSDVAYALEYAAPFRNDQECQRWLRYPEPPDRRRRIEVFCDAYGIGVPDDIVAQVAGQQRLVLERCAALGRRGIEPQATWIRDGYPDTVRARIRWTERLRL